MYKSVTCAVLIIHFCASAVFSNPGVQESTMESHSSGASDSVSLTLESKIREVNGRYNVPPFASGVRPPFGNSCPLCDISVYPYCGEKLFHDACCCADPYNQDFPRECKLADCRFLHANSCREHRLIANCCCSDDYRMVLRSFTKE